MVETETLRIIADETNNALLIMAKPQDYKMIESALKRLDVIPLQVLIEASVVDITLTDNLQYGVEWLFRNTGPGDRTGPWVAALRVCTRRLDEHVVLTRLYQAQAFPMRYSQATIVKALSERAGFAEQAERPVFTFLDGTRQPNCKH